jgi:23S rRNA pseudouridine955/2504/2580 synthase
MRYKKISTMDPETSDPGPVVTASVRRIVVGPEEAGRRLDRVLASLLPGVPKTRLFRLIRRGEVRVNKGRCSPEQRLVAGDEIRVPPVRDPAGESAGLESGEGGGRRVASIATTVLATIEQAIIHEDGKFLALDKPAGIAVHGGSGLSFGVIEALRASRPDETLELAHRLDRDTSGVLLVARRSSALRTLHALFREGAVEKRYLVLVKGRWELGRKRIDAPLRTDTRVGGERTVRVHASGKPSSTEFSLVQQFGARASLLEATLHTGRTHQIRVHAAHCGHPVAGDPKYGDRDFNTWLREQGLARMFLHAHHCSFTWPTGIEVSLSAPLPDALKRLLDQLGTGGRPARRRPAPSGQRVAQRSQGRRKPDER